MSPHRRVVLAATLAGVGVALAVTLLQDSTYRAAGTLVLTREGRAPGDDPTLAPATAAAVELLETRGVAESVVANLRLDDSPAELIDRIGVDADAQSSLLRVSVDGDAAEGARRIAQELAEVFTVLYNTRFGPGVTVSIWEAPRAEQDRVSPRPARNLSLGALAGALAGIALFALRRRPRRVAPAIDRPTIAAVPAPVAPEPVAPAPQPPEPDRSPPSASVPPPVAPPPPRAPEPARMSFVRPAWGEWALVDVERLLAEGGGNPERNEELGVYLASLREVAGPEGQLPRGVQGLVEEVFGELADAQRAQAEPDG